MLPKLFWPTVRTNCSSDWEKLLKFEAVGREFANILRSLEQFFLTVGQNNFGNKIPFTNLKLVNPVGCNNFYCKVKYGNNRVALRKLFLYLDTRLISFFFGFKMDSKNIGLCNSADQQFFVISWIIVAKIFLDLGFLYFIFYWFNCRWILVLPAKCGSDFFFFPPHSNL